MDIGCGISFKNTAWLGHVIVQEEYQNLGIGTFIVDYLCRYLKNKGARSISLITTPGGYSFYRKQGFNLETEYIFLGQNRELEGTVSPKIDQLPKEDHFEVISLDKQVSGEDRSVILKDKLSNTYLYRDEGKIQGYYIPDLGEGLIIAQEVHSGLELMKFRYKKEDKGGVAGE